MLYRRTGILLLITALSLSGCGNDSDGGQDTSQSCNPENKNCTPADAGATDGGTVNSVVPDMRIEGCTPDRATWDSVRPTVETYCGLCHGEMPAFGAPYGLLDFDALITGNEGERPIDRLVARMRRGDMPPAGQPAVPADDAMHLLDWATCGENTGNPPPGPNPGGFDVTRPVFSPEADAPDDANIIELRADNGHIPSDVSDQYTCFSFKGPSGGDRFIQRFEAIVDDTRVLHHIVLYEVPEGAGDGLETECGSNLSAAVYAWAPGQLPIQFVEGGLTTNDSRRYLMEIHYNNSGGYTDVADQSGVRIYHSEPEGPAIDMLTIGPDGFRLPAQTRTSIQGSCTVDTPLTVIATAPHMHEIGVSLKSTIKRADGTEEDLITLVGWDFDTQLFYDGEGLELRPGDEVITECIFENQSDSTRRFGPFTDDEMCYNFLFVTPPPSERRCNENLGTAQYEPGACAPSNAVEIAEETFSNPSEGPAPTGTGGEFPRGDWLMVDYTLVFESADIGIAVLDLEQTTITAHGAVHISTENRIEFDVAAKINAVLTSGGEAAQGAGFSFAGTIVDDDPETGTIRIQRECPDDAEFSTTYSYTDGQLTFFLSFRDMAAGVAVATFERVE